MRLNKSGIAVTVEQAHAFVGSDEHAFICKVVEFETTIGVFFELETGNTARYVYFFGLENVDQCPS